METEKVLIRRVRGDVSRWTHHPAPRPVQRSTVGGPQGLWVLQWENRTQGGHPHLQCFPEANSALASCGSMGNLLDSITRDEIKLKKAGGAAVSATRVKIWAFRFRFLKSKIPACSWASQWLFPSSEPSQWPFLVRERGWQLCLVWVSIQEATVTKVRPLYGPSWQGRKLKAWLNCWCNC